MAEKPAPERASGISFEQVPSLAVVEQALDREDESYRERANGLDTKAGVLLTAAGVIVAVVGVRGSLAGLAAQLAAILAGAAAVATLLPRVDKAIGPRQLRDRYLQLDPLISRLYLMNTRIPLHERNERQLFRKAVRLKVSAAFLLTSAAAIATGGIVDYVTR